MQNLRGRIRDYAWGSTHAIPELFGYGEASYPFAEVWLGAHPAAPSILDDDATARVIHSSDIYRPYEPDPDARTLDAYIREEGVKALGEYVYQRWDGELPYLLKIIAPDQPLSLQVHPNREQAIEGFAREEAAGVPDHLRCYRDHNPKPELVYALSTFEALCGFRAPRRIIGVLDGLDSAVAHRLREIVAREGVRAALAAVLSNGTRPSAEEIAEFAAACQERTNSPSPRADLIVEDLFDKYPTDPGVVASVLLNPVTLRPGEAMFTPVGTVHAYLSGMAMEIMADSDNVLRAGLTPKHIDIPELLRVTNCVAAPPIRIAPERVSPVMQTFMAPVEDFVLSVINLHDATVWHDIRTAGPRILFCLRGAATARTPRETRTINHGEAVFIAANEGQLSLRGAGVFILATVP